MDFTWLKLGSGCWLLVSLVFNEGMQLSDMRFASSRMMGK